MYIYKIYMVFYFWYISVSYVSCCTSETFTDSCVGFCGPDEICHAYHDHGATSEHRTVRKCIENENYELITIKDRVLQFRSGAFNNLPNLYYLIAVKIGLIDLFPNCFQNLPKIDTILVDSNFIQYIPRGVFSGLPVRFVNLSYNNILEIREGAFQNMDKLEELDLSHNKLTHLNLNTFKYTKNIKNIKLNHNNITYIADGYWEQFHNLLTLNLRHNNILQDVASRAFNRITSLESLDLSQNYIRYLEIDFFSHNTRIDKLDLSMNNITYIDSRLLNKLKIKTLLMLPNPLSCPCMWRIMETGRENGVTISNPLYRHRNNSIIDYPVCVVPLKNHKCFQYGEVFDEDSYEYFKHFSYTKLQDQEVIYKKIAVFRDKCP